MRMKKSIRSVLFIAFILMCGESCSPIENINNENRGIYGTITDFATGEPVASANVQLRPSGETTLTGSDGTYEFKDIAKGDYSITVSKAEYTDLIDDYVITVDSRMMRRDVQIKKLPAYLHIVDNNLNEISSLDFGAEATSKQFVIFNSGPVAINCSLSTTCKWVSNFSSTNVSIPSGGTLPVIVTIDRSKLPNSTNSDFIHVTSNNGNKQIEIKARK